MKGINLKRLAIVFLVLCIIFVVSCGGDNSDSEEVFPYSDLPLDEVIKNSYDKKELDAFFESRTLNEYFYNGIINENDILSFAEVNDRFPIELEREEGYSVYKTDQGGYYYVFWIKMSPNKSIFDSSTIQKSDQSVLCTLYFSPNEKRIGIIDVVSKGDTIHNLHDVDPYVYLNNLMSSGIYAYSFVDKKTVIEYRCTYENDNYFVNTKRIVPINSAACVFRAIRDGDYPK